MKKMYFLSLVFIALVLSGCNPTVSTTKVPVSDTIKPAEIPKIEEPVVIPPVEEQKEPEAVEPETLDTSNWKTYKDIPFADMSDHKPWGFQIQYPSGYEQIKGDNLEYPVGSFLKGNSAGGAGVSSYPVSATISILSDEKFSGTDVFYEWLSIAYNPDIANENDCKTLARNNTSNLMTEHEIVGDISWYYQETSAAAAGTSIISHVYHTLYNGMCYEVAQHMALASEDVGNSSNNISKVWSDLEGIFSTWKFLNK